MNLNIIVRQYIQQTLKDFPWSYPEQETHYLSQWMVFLQIDIVAGMVLSDGHFLILQLKNFHI